VPSAEHQAVVDLLVETRAVAGEAQPTLDEERARLDGLADLLPVSPDVEVTPVEVDGVPAEWLDAPGVDADRVVVYLHGGAYTRGSVRSHRSLCGRLSLGGATRVLSVDYRLAPEHPYPAAVDDAVTAYRWALEQGYDPERIAIAGDSAGGGLAAALLLALRAGADPLPAGAVLLSPWIDLTLSGASMDERAGADPICSRSSLAPSAAWYAGEEDLACPLVSPLFGDLAGLPPLLILVGTAEVLLDDSLRLAAAADAAGVDMTLVVEDDLLHVWPIFQGVPESDAALDLIADWVRTRTGS
jgi:acetyl esterase/lipase